MAGPSRQGGEQDAVGMHAEMATLGLVQSFSYSYPYGHSVRKACARIKGSGICMHLCEVLRILNGSVCAPTSHVVLGPARQVVVAVFHSEDHVVVEVLELRNGLVLHALGNTRVTGSFESGPLQNPGE